MKMILSTLVLLSASVAFADAPVVKCQLDMSPTEGEFVAGDVVEVQMGKEATLTNGKFELTAKLSQICASDGRRCIDAYKLTTVVTRGTTYATTTSTTPFRSQDLQLAVGKARAFSLCVTE